MDFPGPLSALRCVNKQICLFLRHLSLLSFTLMKNNKDIFGEYFQKFSFLLPTPFPPHVLKCGIQHVCLFPFHLCALPFICIDPSFQRICRL